MADGSGIEWTDATWQPITGCSVVSPGCKHCYAMRLAGTRLKHHPSRAGLTVETAAGPVWKGQVRFNAAWLGQPLRWSRPRRVFVCAHGDLFHEAVRDHWIDQVFAVMALSPQHTFQVLTKRPAAMRIYCNDPATPRRVWDAAQRIGDVRWALAENGGSDWPWPLRNVWAGVSVEDEERARKRVPHLTRINAALRWISAEPLLGQVSLRQWLPSLDWVVVGGESGPGARSMEAEWAVALRNECDRASVPFFMKQMARREPIPDDLMLRQYPEAA